MTVEQLIEILKSYKPSKKILISSDAEGNNVYKDIYVEDYDDKRLVLFGEGELVN